MFRLSLRGKTGNSGVLELKEMEMDYPYSLLLHDKHAPNNLFFTINTIRSENVKGSYIIAMCKMINIGGFNSTTLENKYDDKTISTPKEKPIYLEYPKEREWKHALIQGGMFKGLYKYNQINHYFMYPDTESVQHILLGRQILINGTSKKESNPENIKKPFPSLLLEKDVCFILEYLDKNNDGSDYKITNEKIDIYATIFQK